MIENLKADELAAMIKRVFEPTDEDTALAVLVDLPDDALPDNDDWAQRRAIAADWVRELAAARDDHGLDIDLVVYRNVRANNADLPATAWLCEPDDLPATADDLDPAAARPFAEILDQPPARPRPHRALGDGAAQDARHRITAAAAPPCPASHRP